MNDVAETRQGIFCSMQLRCLVHPLGIVILISLLFALPLFWFGFPPSNHDGAIHVRWTHHAAVQFWSGSFYPRYFPELNHNFGSPSFFLYPPLSTLASVLLWPLAPEQGRDWYALGWSAAIGMVLSGVFMWAFLQRYTSHRWAATVGALLYVIAPYHLGIDLLDRGANAEFWAFAFMPLVLFSFHRLSNEGQKEYLTAGTSPTQIRYFARCCTLPSNPITLAAFSLAALFCCHVLTAIAFAPVALAYALSLGRATFLRSLTAGFWSLLLSVIYLLPAAMCSSSIGSNQPFFMGEYFRTSFFFPDLQLQAPFLETDVLLQHFHHRLFAAFAGALVVQAACFLSLLLGVISASQTRRMVMLIMLLQFYILMMLPVSEPLYVIFRPLQRLQFAWRFLSPATLICATMISVLLVQRQRLSFKNFIIIGVAVATLISTSVYASYGSYRRNFLTEEGAWRKEVPPTDFQSIDGFGEYVPSNTSIDAAENFFGAATNLPPWTFRLISGSGRISIKDWDPRRLIIESDSEDGARFVLHQFWIPGWVAKDLASGKMLSVTRHNDSGLLEIGIPQGHSRINLRLSVLWPEAIGIATSTASAVWLVGIMASRFFARKRLRNRDSDAAMPAI